MGNWANYAFEYVIGQGCKYQILVKTAHWYAWATPGVLANNYVIEATARVSNGTTGAAGLLFGITQDQTDSTSSSLGQADNTCCQLERISTGHAGVRL